MSPQLLPRLNPSSTLLQSLWLWEQLDGPVVSLPKSRGHRVLFLIKTSESDSALELFLPVIYEKCPRGLWAIRQELLALIKVQTEVLGMLCVIWRLGELGIEGKASQNPLQDLRGLDAQSIISMQVTLALVALLTEELQT